MADTKTLSSQHADSVKALDLELAGVELALQQANQQMRGLNARRQRLVQVRNSLLVLCGLDANAYYRFDPAKAKGRTLPHRLTEEEVSQLVRDFAARQQGAQVPAVPAPVAAPEPGA